MIDPKILRDNPKLVEKAAKAKGVTIDVKEVAQADERRREIIQELDALRAEQNEKSKEKVDESARDALRSLKDKIKTLEGELAGAEKEFTELAYQIPNLPADDVPVGKDESENQVIRQWGEVPQFDFEPLDHVALGEQLDIIDIERAAKVTGSRFAFLKGAAARLEVALLQFVFSALTDRETVEKIARGVSADCPAKLFTPVIPPVMIRPDVFTKMARLSPEEKDERYYLPQDDLFLVGSAEHTLGAMHMGEIIPEDQFPLRYIGFSTSFRRESGSYGKDVRGILRVHQFDKLEMESFTTPEAGRAEQDFLVAVQEYLLQQLRLPYQVVMICTGDMGKPDARQIDIETWLPGQDRYRETHTADYMGDYQARRLETRVRRRDGAVELVHMNDATAIAMSRIPIAILENYQTKEGTVVVPEVLRQFMGIDEIK